jgi:hypothetical protein
MHVVTLGVEESSDEGSIRCKLLRVSGGDELDNAPLLEGKQGRAIENVVATTTLVIIRFDNGVAWWEMRDRITGVVSHGFAYAR